jgi:ATP-dependent phosphofructokinase / diphosphate-dependent phosphofructokinase
MTKQRRATGKRKRNTAQPSARADDGPAFKRVCILTGGGDAPGLNAVIRAFVKTCEPLGIDVWGSEDGFEGLIQPGRLVQLSRASVRGILPKGGSILGCSNRANPFAYPIKDRRGRERTVDVSDDVIGRVRKHQIDALVLAGGDGTMRHAAAFMNRGLPVIGVPKTIDNDLVGTDYSFGFDTALSTATWAIDALHATAESHDRIMVVEVMGRYAGWIALCSGIAGGADVILIPEIPYDIERVVAKLRARSEQGSSFSIVVVGEGARPKGGARSTVARARKGQLERLGGAGQLLADQLADRIAHDIRVTVLGHLQRGGSPTAFDRLLGTRLGVHAARCCELGDVGVMVALHGQEIVTVPIAETVRSPKLVEPSGELARAARSIGIELGS